MSREDSGAAALSGRDLPTDQALAAHARVCARAREYKESRVFPVTRASTHKGQAIPGLARAMTGRSLPW
jgi:hypothetical protein